MTTKVTRNMLNTSIDDNGNATAITIDANENLGLASRLSVGTTTVGGGNTKIVATGSADNYIQLVSSTGNGGVSLGNAGGGNLLIYTHTGALGAESFSERMRITSAGKVGIGTSSPSKFLTISGDDAEFLLNRTGSYADTINMGAPSGVPTIVGGTDLAFGGNGTWNEHMRIHSDGRVNIGAQGDGGKFYVYGDTSGAYLSRFHHDGNNNDRYGLRLIVGADSASTGHIWIRFDDGDGHAQGYMYHDNGSVVINQSDERLKENIIDSPLEGINILKQIQQREFNWKRDTDKTKTIGYIAQELETVYPAAVVAVSDKSGDGVVAPDDDPDNPYKFVAKERLIDVLIKAAQEQQEQIESLQQEIEVLKNG